MPNFNFNFNSITSKTNKKEHTTINSIIKENIEGVINVELNGTFYVLDSEKNKYNINIKNYSCKNKTVVYPLLIDTKNNSRIKYIRNENKQELSNKAYLPFAPGLCVKGDIILKDNKTYFNIKNIYVDNNVEGAKEAFKFYKENFKVIIKNIKNG